MDEKTSSAPMQEDPQKGEELSFTITGEDAEAQDALNAEKPEPQQKKKSPLPWILGAAAVVIAAALVLILTIKPSQTTPDADQPGDTGIVKTEYGYHVMYFSSVCEHPYWYVRAESDYLNKLSADVSEEVSAKFESAESVQNAALADILQN